ncbi:MAG: TolC family protein [Bacteroidales bacterium]|nr:TolC family protein [Bacteroidales bacterium]MDY6171421.1 TolC family protein [Candidatus Cryptobacteroides sp.]
MKNVIVRGLAAVSLLCLSFVAGAQYRDGVKPDTAAETAGASVQQILEAAGSSDVPVVITLDQALQIALSENIAVKVADKEIERTKYAKRGTYAALFPQIDGSGSYQRTIKRQVVYFDGNPMAGLGGSSSGSGSTSGTGSGSEGSTSSSKGGGIEMGRLNTMSFGVSAAMPIVNAQLWESVKITGMDVELAVEKARSSRLNMVSQVKNAYYAALFAKEAFDVYREVYENALNNYYETEKKYNVQKATELDMARAKTNVANAIPNVYNAESSVMLSLWQLKAVMGVDLEMNIDVVGSINDYAGMLEYDTAQHNEISLESNSTMKQLAIQAEELARSIRLKQYAYIPTLSLAFNFSGNTMFNDVPSSQWNWTPYSTVGLSLQIPIFSGLKRMNDVKQARNQYQQMQYNITDTERNLKIAIRQSLNTMDTNVKSYSAAEEAVDAAQKAYNIASKSYEVGRATLTDLNDAQLALTQAKLSQSQAIYNFVVAKTSLEQNLGYDFTTEE